MKTTPLRRLLAAAALAASFATVASAAPMPAPPKLTDVLHNKAGRVLIFQPVHMRRGQTLVVTHTKLGDGSVRPGEQRALELVVYSSTRSELTGEFPVLFSDMQITDGTAESAGPHVMVFNGFLNDVDDQGIIAVLIGLLLPAVQTDPVKMVALPSGDVLSAEIVDPSGPGLLLPAVLKIRATAGR
jgi:hypothetical protein